MHLVGIHGISFATWYSESRIFWHCWKCLWKLCILDSTGVFCDFSLVAITLSDLTWSKICGVCRVRITVSLFLVRNSYKDNIVSWNIGMVEYPISSVPFLRTLCQSALPYHATALQLITPVLRFTDLVLWFPVISLPIWYINITPWQNISEQGRGSNL